MARKANGRDRRSLGILRLEGDQGGAAMTIRVHYHDGTTIDLVAVESVTMAHIGEIRIKCFGNESVLHKNVDRVEVLEMGYELL